MRIDEVPSRDAMAFNLKDWKNLNEIRKYLRGKGYKKLGSGLYAEVWRNKEADRIVKISTQEDKCWMRYVEWLRNQPPMRHLPKIYSFRTYTAMHRGKERTLFIAIVETLDETAELRQKLWKKIRQAPDRSSLLTLMWLNDITWVNPRSTHLSTVRLKAVKAWLDQQPEFKKLDDSQRADKLLASAHRLRIAQLGAKATKELGKGECAPDLHGGNVMYRASDNSIVITDPIANALGG